MFSKRKRKKGLDAEGEPGPPQLHASDQDGPAPSQNDEAERISQDFIFASLEALKHTADAVAPEPQGETAAESAPAATDEPEKFGESPTESSQETQNLAEQIMAAGQKASASVAPACSSVPEDDQTIAGPESDENESRKPTPPPTEQTSDNNKDRTMPRRQLDEILVEIVKRDIARRRGSLN